MKKSFIYLITLLTVSQFIYSQTFLGSDLNPAKGLNGKYGYNRWNYEVGEDKNIIPFQYDWVSNFDYSGFASICNNNKFGIIDYNGKVLIPLEYEYAFPPRNGLSVVIKDGKFGAINSSTFQLVIPFDYDAIQNNNGNFLTAFRNNRWGLISSKNEVIVPFTYIIMGTFENQFTRAVTEKGKEVWFTPTGQLFNYDKVSPDPLTNRLDYIIVTKDPENKKGLINDKQEFLLDPIYDEIKINMDDFMATVTKDDGTMGLYNFREKKWIYNLEYYDLEYENKSVAVSKKEGDQYFLMDLKGTKIIPEGFEIAYPFSKYNIAKVVKNGKVGFIDRVGQIIVPKELKQDDDYEVTISPEGYIIGYKEKEGWGVTDKYGKTIIPYKFSTPRSSYGPFNGWYNNQDNFAVVRENQTGNQGIVNRKGEWVIPLKTMDYIMIYDNRLTTFQDENGKQGIFDLINNSWILKPEYKWVLHRGPGALFLRNDNSQIGYYRYSNKKFFESSDFSYDLYDSKTENFVITNNNLAGLADNSGKPITAIKYAKSTMTSPGLSFSSNGLFFASYNDKIGFLNKYGKEVIPVIYDIPNKGERHDFDDNQIFVRKAGKGLLINSNGEVLIKESDFNSDNIKMIKKITAGQIEFFTATTSDDKQQEVLLNKKSYIQEEFGYFGHKDFTSFREGLMPLKYNGKYGYVDIYGTLVIAHKFDFASNFENGLAIVKNGDEIYLIDRKGNKTSVINPFSLTLILSNRKK